MSLRAIRWATVVAPLLFLLVLDVVRHEIFALHNWPWAVGILILLAGGILLFSKMVLDHIETMQRRIVDQNRELAAMEEVARGQAEQLRTLHAAGLALTANLSLDTVLERVVGLARDLVGARYGALSVLGEGNEIERFITSGLSAEESARIGSPPKGRGLLGLLLTEGVALRIRDISSHPASVGFPPGHPQMTSFLGVPIAYKGRVMGNLYLTDKLGAPEFSEADEAVLALFAAQAAVAIENARLHAQVQQLAIEEERQRIAREMHDGLAQVLGYVNVKAGAVRHLLDLRRVNEAAQELQQLEVAAQEVYGEVREAILNLRTITQGGGGLVVALRGYLERFSEQSGIPVTLSVEGDEAALALRPEAEVQLIRVIQEALNNVRKHAKATHARVSLGQDRDCIVLTVEDDGQGFDQNRIGSGGGPRFGLQTMRERAESLGGSFSIGVAEGGGTRVMVRLPRTAAVGA